MIVDRTSGQVCDFHALGRNFGRALLIGEAHHRVGIGNVEIAAYQSHAEGRVEPGQECRPSLGTSAPTHFMTSFMTQAATPVCPGCGGALVSATTRSPFGST